VKDHLNYPVFLMQGNRIRAHIGEAEGELSPETGVYKPPSQQHPASCKGRTAPQGRCQVCRKLHPLQAGDECARAGREDDILPNPEVIGGRLLAGFGIGAYDKVTTGQEALLDDTARENHYSSVYREYP